MWQTVPVSHFNNKTQNFLGVGNIGQTRAILTSAALDCSCVMKNPCERPALPDLMERRWDCYGFIGFSVLLLPVVLGVRLAFTITCKYKSQKNVKPGQMLQAIRWKMKGGGRIWQTSETSEKKCGEQRFSRLLEHRLKISMRCYAKTHVRC